MFALVVGVLFPTAPTALSMISDFGIIVALLFLTIGVVKKFTNW